MTEDIINLRAVAIAEEEEPANNMSFPAVLRNARLTALVDAGKSGEKPSATPTRKDIRKDKEGKRWIRRSDNAKFKGNPHIMPPTAQDYGPDLHHYRAFPEPLPAYLPRNPTAPSAAKVVPDPRSSNAGRFSLSLKGMRRDLRKSGLRAQQLVQSVEKVIVDWLEGGVVHLDSEQQPAPTTVVDPSGAIVEISRTPQQLVWSIPDDPFARWIVHCVARWFGVVSFSKEPAGSTERYTYLLRPNHILPDHVAASKMQTPTVTDISDVASDLTDNCSEADSDFPSPLPAVAEIEGTPVKVGRPRNLSVASSMDSYVVVGEQDTAEWEDDTAARVASLSLQNTPLSTIPVTASPERPSRFRPQNRNSIRSASSPSRSPIRMDRFHNRRPTLVTTKVNKLGNPTSTSFYAYIFS